MERLRLVFSLQGEIGARMEGEFSPFCFFHDDTNKRNDTRRKEKEVGGDGGWRKKKRRQTNESDSRPYIGQDTRNTDEQLDISWPGPLSLLIAQPMPGCWCARMMPVTGNVAQ